MTSATKHVYYGENPSSARAHHRWWRPAAMAAANWRRARTIDLLFVRPFKADRLGESVIEFILYMLWDLG